MSKFGKTLGPVVALLAIAVAVLAVLIALQGRQFRYRSQYLAQSLSDTAAALDSESGVSSQVNFSKAGDNNKEGGTLGWGAAKQAGDLTNASNSYASTTRQVVELANNVVEQRNAIIEKLIGLSNVLECPGAQRPEAEKLQNVTSYSEGTTDAFEAFVKNRVSRDRNIQAAINKFLGEMGCRGSYSARITADGQLAAEDKGVLADASSRFKALSANYRTYQNFQREMIRELSGARVNGVTWQASATDMAFSKDGMNAADASSIAAAMQKIRADVASAKQQLNTIDVLKKNIKDLEADVAARDAKIDELLARITEVSKLVEMVYAAGGMEFDKRVAIEPKTSFAEIDAKCAGHIMRLNPQYGYAIIDLNCGDVIPGLKLGVYSKGNFVGLLQVVEAGQFNSLASVASGNIADMSVGDTIIVANEALQDAEVIGK